MKRLIDAVWLEVLLKKALDVITNNIPAAVLNEDEDLLKACQNQYSAYSTALALLDHAPTVEAVPVVRCKDCKHWGAGIAAETECVKCCVFGKYMVGENGYCVYGEMRKGKE